MRKILGALLALCLLVPPVYGQSSKATLNSLIDTNFADNTAGLITPLKMRTTIKSVVASYVDWLSCTGTGGLVFWSAGTPTCLTVGTAGQVLQVSSGLPSWSSVTHPTSATSGGIACFTSATAMVSSVAMTANAIMLGGGAGVCPSPMGSLGTTTTVLHGNASGAPTFSQIVAGDVTTNTLTNATLAQANAWTLKGNASGSTANVSDFTVTGLTLKATPGASDEVLISDASASNAFKKTTVSALASAGSVSSIDAKVGAFTTGNGLDSTGGNVIELTAARRTTPTVSIVTTGSHSGGFAANGSGTYTTPANVQWIEITLVGGGAGGSGNSASGAAAASCWNTTGAACTTPVYSAGGGNAAAGGAIAGSATCNVLALTGSGGQGGSTSTAGTSSAGGIGGSTILQGAGVGVLGAAGSNANADTGSGGGGGGISAAVGNTSTGGGSGATCRVMISAPAATYTYVVGTKSTGGAAGGSILAGGNGADGRIIVIEHYGT